MGSCAFNKASLTTLSTAEPLTVESERRVKRRREEKQKRWVVVSHV